MAPGDRTAGPERMRGRFRHRQTWYLSQSPLQTLVDFMLDSLSGPYLQPPLVPMDDESLRLMPPFFHGNIDVDLNEDNYDGDIVNEPALFAANPFHLDDTGEDYSIPSTAHLEREIAPSDISTTSYSAEEASEVSSESSASGRLLELTHNIGTSTFSNRDIDEDSSTSFSSDSAHLSTYMPTPSGYYFGDRDGDNAISIAVGDQDATFYGSPVRYYTPDNVDDPPGYDSVVTNYEQRYTGTPTDDYIDERNEYEIPPYINGLEAGHISTPANFYMEGGPDSPRYIGDEPGEEIYAPAPPGYYVERTDDMSAGFGAEDNEQEPADDSVFITPPQDLP